ncbi:MAG: hypothetical protein JW753_03610, partial [Dehalococcoidia bacterium]|nr:hypothetical protein [Dehalococcoidia bacterium]
MQRSPLAICGKPHGRLKAIPLLGLILAVALALILVVSTALPALADTAGPNYAGTGASVDGPGTIAWTNPTNIYNDDTSYATATNIAYGGTSEYLEATNFSLGIPAFAVINGITVAINRCANGAFTTNVYDGDVRLVKAGTIVGDDKGTTTTWVNGGPGPGTFRLDTYGGTGDLWGTTWTAADINDTSFGVVVSAYNNTAAGARSAWVDYVRITVTYTLAVATTLTVDAASGTYGSTCNLTATLSPAVASETINFYINGESKGSASTDGSGVATLNDVALTVGGIPLDVGTYTGTYNTSGVGANFAGDTGYGASSDAADLAVSPRAIEVTADDQSKTYGDADPALTYQITSGSLAGT